jgi:polyphosphate kinase
MNTLELTLASSGASVTGDELAELKRRFEREIFPLLTPLAVDPGHPLPFVPSLSLNLAVFVREPTGGDIRFALVQLPQGLSPLVSVGGRGLDVAIEDVVVFFLPRLFPQMEIIEFSFFRVTRVVNGRTFPSPRRSTRVARLDVSGLASDRMVARLLGEFEVHADRVHLNMRPEGPP